jgi:hypothetical protein
MDLSYTAIVVLTAGLAITLPVLMGLLFAPKRKLTGKHVLITGGSKVVPARTGGPATSR